MGEEGEKWGKKETLCEEQITSWKGNWGRLKAAIFDSYQFNLNLSSI